MPDLSSLTSSPLLMIGLGAVAAVVVVLFVGLYIVKKITKMIMWAVIILAVLAVAGGLGLAYMGGLLG